MDSTSEMGLCDITGGAVAGLVLVSMKEQ